MHSCKRDLVLGGKWSAARDHFVEEHAQRIDIAARIGLAIAHEQLGRNIIDSPQYVAGGGEGTRIVHDARHAQIGQVAEVISAEKNIGRFDIAMNNTMKVEICLLYTSPSPRD